MQTSMFTTATDEELSYKMSFREKFSFGAGDFACNLSWNFISGFLLYFFTNVALLPAAVTMTWRKSTLGLSENLRPAPRRTPILGNWAGLPPNDQKPRA